MKRIKEIFLSSRKTKPLDSDTFVIGLFQVAFGLWVMAPMKSFAFIPTTDIDGDAEIINVFTKIGEVPLGFIVLMLGFLDIYGVYYKKYNLLKNMAIVGAAYWAFISMGWIIEVPASTAVPVYTFFTVFSIYEFFVWASYCAHKKLRNKENVDNI